MKTTTRSSVVLTAALLAFASASFPNAQAAISLETAADIWVANAGDGQYGGGSYNRSDTGAPVSANETYVYGMNHSNGLITFSGEAAASVTFGQLRTSASGSVTNAYYDPDSLIFDGEGNFNQDGIPGFYAVQAYAAFSDTLIPATGFGAAKKTNFLYHITGSFTGMNAQHELGVTFNGQTQSITLNSTGSEFPTLIGQTWATEMFDIPQHGLPFEKSVWVNSQFTLSGQYDHVVDGEDYAGSANFMNTVTLVGINVYDENDNLLTGWTITSGSGTVYPVPEPSAALLGLAGVAGFLARRRRA